MGLLPETWRLGRLESPEPEEIQGKEESVRGGAKHREMTAIMMELWILTAFGLSGKDR
jgi:hypothetical protein